MGDNLMHQVQRLLPASFSGAETAAAASTSEMYSREQHAGKKPKRMVLLTLCMLLIGGITYVINILCGFLLKLADNEKFISQIASTMKKCSSPEMNCKQDNFTLADENNE